MKRPAALLLGVLTAFSLGLPPAGAAGATALTLTQQAKKAEVIVRGTLGTSTRVKEGDVTWVVYPITVTETVAGDVATLPQTEGKPALYLLDGLEGLPQLRAGQEGFFLLYSRRFESPFVGFDQGVYPIENGQVTRLPGSEAAGPGTTTVPQGTVPTATAAPAAPAATVPTATTPSAPLSNRPGAPGGAPPTPTTAPAPTTPTEGAPVPPPTSGTAAASPSGAGPSAAGSPPPSTSASPTPEGAAPGTPAATSPAPSATPPANPLSDPARFRDALRAAREAK